MRRKLSFIAVVVLPNLAFAAGNSIESGLQSAGKWAGGIGLMIAGIGGIFAGVKFTQNHPEAKDHAKGVAIGAAIIASASTVVGLISGWFK